MAKADGLEAGDKDSDERWSEDLAREAWLEALSCFDAVNAARAGLPLFDAAPAPSVIVAHDEAVARVVALARAAHSFALETLRAIDARTQRQVIAAVDRLAHDAWLRADTLAPGIAASRASHPEVYRHGSVFSPEALQGVFDAHRTLSTPEAREVVAPTTLPPLPAGVPGAICEMLEHFWRLGGNPMPATEAPLVRFARGAVSTARVKMEFEGLKRIPIRSPGEAWAYLLSTGEAIKSSERTRGLAPLVTFVEAVRLLGFGEGVNDVIARGRLPMFSPRWLQYRQGVDDYDGPRTLALKALRILGHDPAAFTGAERAAKVRKADKARPNRPRAKGGRPRKGP